MRQALPFPSPAGIITKAADVIMFKKFASFTSNNVAEGINCQDAALKTSFKCFCTVDEILYNLDVYNQILHILGN